MMELDDHDQRFKALIRTFFADFLTLFFADWAARFDLSTIEWLDKEVLPDPPDGSRHVLDLVARLRAKEPIDPKAGDDPTTCLALVHIEIESPDRTTLLAPRLPAYFVHLRQQERLPVLPIVIYLKVGLDGIGVDMVVERFWELDVLTFKHLYVGLPALNAEEYVQGENWLGVALAALMRIPKDRVAWLGAEALRKIAGAPLTDQQRFLLGECVEAYLPLDVAQRAAYRRMIEGVSEPGIKAMNETTYDRGLKKGREEGRRLALLELVEALLETKFPAQQPEVMDRVRQLPDDRLRELALAIPNAQSLADLGL